MRNLTSLTVRRQILMTIRHTQPDNGNAALKTQHERMTGGVAVIENTTAQSPYHQGHRFFWLLYQGGLHCQRSF